MPRRSAADPILASREDRPALACLRLATLLVAGAVGCLAMVTTVITDVRVENVLKERGVKAQATFTETYCGKCASLPITFRTSEGQTVTADLPVAGEPDDTTVLVRYDPRRPTRVHPANGVVYDEVVSGLLALAALVVAVYAAARLTRAAQAGRSRRAWPTSSHERAQISHVKVVQP